MMPPPALLTSTSSVPKASTADLMTPPAISSRDRSPAPIFGRSRPAAAMPSATRPRRSPSTSDNTRRAPASAKCRAITAPIPLAAPVTTTTCPAKREFICLASNSQYDTDSAAGAEAFAGEKAALFPDPEAVAVPGQSIVVGAEIEIGGAVLGTQGLEYGTHFQLVVGS